MSVLPTVTPAARERIGDLDRDLSELREGYELAKTRRLNNPETLAVLDRVLDMVDAFRASDGGEKAIYLIGLLQGYLSPQRANRQLIAKVEELRERRRKLEKP